MVYRLAERVGFEPTLRYNRRPLFESGTMNHSDTSPGFKFYPKTPSKGKIYDIADILPTIFLKTLIAKSFSEVSGNPSSKHCALWLERTSFAYIMRWSCPTTPFA